MNTFYRNWRTSLGAVLSFVLGVPVLANAIYDYANHRPVDWRFALVSAAMALASSGLIFAKDQGVHSTINEAQTASIVAEQKGHPDPAPPPMPPGPVEEVVKPVSPATESKPNT